MKSNFKLALVFLSMAAVCGWALENRAAVEIMLEVKKRYAKVSENISKGSFSSELDENLNALRNLMEELKESHKRRYGGTPERWRERCELNLLMIQDIQTAAGQRDLKGTREALGRLKAAQKEAHACYRAGLLKRIFTRRKKDC